MAQQRPEFEEVTESEEVEKRENLKNKSARLEAIVGSEKLIEIITKEGNRYGIRTGCFDM